MRYICFLTLSMCFWLVLPAAAESEPNVPIPPAQLLELKWDAVIAVLQNEQFDDKQKIEQVKQLALPAFDFPLMAKLTLGREHWPKLDETQRKRFTASFETLLQNAYTDKIMLYEDESFAIKTPIEKRGTVQVPMELISSDKTISMMYKFREVKKHWLIYDVDIEGVSLIMTYRSQFNDILKDSDVETLLTRMEKGFKEE